MFEGGKLSTGWLEFAWTRGPRSIFCALFCCFMWPEICNIWRGGNNAKCVGRTSTDSFCKGLTNLFLTRIFSLSFLVLLVGFLSSKGCTVWKIMQNVPAERVQFLQKISKFISHKEFLFVFSLSFLLVFYSQKAALFEE